MPSGRCCLGSNNKAAPFVVGAGTGNRGAGVGLGTAGLDQGAEQCLRWPQRGRQQAGEEKGRELRLLIYRYCSDH